MNLLNVLPFQETLNAGMCGPASLKMVLAYWGIEKTEQELADLCQADSRLGIADQDIARVAESLGLRVEIKNLSTLDDIHEWLDKKIPVIVDWFTRGRGDSADSAVADGHYSVVVGLDENSIYIQDPEIGALRTIPRDDFMRVWFDFSGDTIDSWDNMIVRQTIVIHPGPSQPA